MRKRTSIFGLISWILLCFVVAWFGSLFEPGDWYAQLTKPSWNPPNWIFPTVWTVLYLMMAVAAWLIWKEGKFAGNPLPLVLFLIQLFLNAIWSWLFFGQHLIGVALGELLLLWIFILLTVVSFWRVKILAGILLLPYFLWVSFAALLNYRIWQLNT